MKQRLASLSLDLDNKWSYLKTQGLESWQSLPSYFDLVVPRILGLLARRDLTMTCFVVGQDAVLPKNHEPLSAIVAAGHEIGNHSFLHEPWLHEYTPTQLRDDFDRSEAAIGKLAGYRPIGFRGPGFSLSAGVLSELSRRGYAYDASTFPTFIGPLARAYFFARSPLSGGQLDSRRKLYGSLRDGLRSLRAYDWKGFDHPLLEIPVTTFPLVRSPIHLTYLVYLSRWSEPLAMAYLQSALRACRWSGVAPSFLLHPTDFLGGDEEPDLSFFPGMDINANRKLAFVERVLDCLQRGYDCVPLRDHAEAVLGCPIELRTADHQHAESPHVEVAPRAEALV